MAIVYPLSMPGLQDGQKIKLASAFAVAAVTSPFTKQTQLQEWPGSAWAAQVSMPPIKDRRTAEKWIAFLLKLNGISGSFLLGDPNGLSNLSGVPIVGRNLLLYSEQMDNAIWTKQMLGAATVTVTPNYTADPNGFMRADRVQIDLHGDVNGVGTCEQIGIGGGLVPGHHYQGSVYLKTNDGSTKHVWVSDDQSGSTSTLMTVNGTWQRFNPPSSVYSGLGTFPFVRVELDGSSIRVGSDTSADLAIWGAQVEDGSSVGPYQVTFGVAPGPPVVDGSGQSGKSLNIKGLPLSATGVILTGDYFSLGSGATTRLYKSLNDVNSDANGKASIDVFPRLRESPTDDDIVNFINAVGAFRLADNNQGAFELDQALSYGISFSAVEAL